MNDTEEKERHRWELEEGVRTMRNYSELIANTELFAEVSLEVKKGMARDKALLDMANKS